MAAARGMRALRAERGWTNADLAAELGVKRDWVRRREHGATRITEPEAERIGKALGTDADGLIAAGGRREP
jgi:transcriptional regulator with XRE-family HTH domain